MVRQLVENVLPQRRRFVVARGRQIGEEVMHGEER
jgi:hypothetical protein